MQWDFFIIFFLLLIFNKTKFNRDTNLIKVDRNREKQNYNIYDCIKRHHRPVINYALIKVPFAYKSHALRPVKCQ